MLSALKAFNLLVMFLLELAVYAAALLWGFTSSDKWLAKLALGIGVPVALMVTWALFGAPRASHPAHGGARVLLEVVWFGTGAAALAATGRYAWAAGFAGIFLVNAALRLLWN
ncbi:YrdB family protein [Streptomyces sp. AM 2-1-1]|nr:YrdB family protein [Streptomyces sp. AM 2-1-1]WEH39050.1 YrdB family protein [Streptomyces sp. AM 2-1-1]